MQSDYTRDLAARVERLERQNRRFKQAATVAMIAGSSILLFAQTAPQRQTSPSPTPPSTAAPARPAPAKTPAPRRAPARRPPAPPQPKPVEASEFILKDGGVVRARLGTVNGAAELALSDQTGKQHAVVSVRKEGAPSIRLLGDSGDAAILLDMAADGARVVLQDAGGKPRASLISAGAGPAVVLFDAAGRERGRFTVAGDTPVLTLQDAAGHPRAALTLEGEMPALNLNDAAGKLRAGLGMRRNRPEMTLADETGQPRAAVTAEADGAILGLRDAHGKLRIAVTALSDQPQLIIADSDEIVRAALRTSSIQLSDAEGQAIIGSTDITRGRGAPARTPAASITLSDKNGRVLWNAP